MVFECEMLSECWKMRFCQRGEHAFTSRLIDAYMCLKVVLVQVEGMDDVWLTYNMIAYFLHLGTCNGPVTHI